MDNDSNSSADWYQLLGWVHANRKKIIIVSAIILVVGGSIGVWNWQKNHHELVASEALSQLTTPSTRLTASNAAPYLKLADDYPNTSAGARARLLAAGVLFRAGSFKEAGDQFQRFLQDYPDFRTASEAMLGKAACLDAQGKTTNAINAYEDLIKHHAGDNTTSQAKAALARLYVLDHKPDMALHLYEDLMRASTGNDSWTIEAALQREELLEQHPELKPPPPVVPVMNTPTNFILPPPASNLPPANGAVTTAPGTNLLIKQP